MSELTPIPTDQRHAYLDALTAGRDEAERLGYGAMDDRVFASFHRALYRPMLDAHAAEVRQKERERGAAALPAILLAHGRNDIRACQCGWSELGRSHVTHVVQMWLDAVARGEEADRG